MINNKFCILRRDLLKELYQDETTSTTHIPVYLNDNRDDPIGNALEDAGDQNGGTYVLNLQEEAAERLSAYEMDYDFDYTVLARDDETGEPLQIKVNHIYIVEK